MHARRVLAILLAVLAPAASAAIPASASSTLPVGVTEEVVFQEPLAGGTDLTIHNRLVTMINQTPAGEEIDESAYSITWAPWVDANLTAAQRGVRVYVAANSSSVADTTQYNRLRDGLNAMEGPGHFVRCYAPPPITGTTAVHGCIGDRSSGYSHIKSTTFSATGGKKNVVVVASTNPTNEQLNKWNNAIIVSGDAVLYGEYVQHIKDMLAQHRDNNYMVTSHGTITSAASQISAEFSPRADSTGGTSAQASTDNVVLALRRLTPGAGCWVDSEQAYWETSRTPVTKQVIYLQQHGCVVRVVERAVQLTVIDQLRAAGVTVKHWGTDHNKVWVLHGTIDGVPNSTVAYAGSQNIQSSSLRKADEDLLHLRYDPVVRAFQAHFERVWALAA